MSFKEQMTQAILNLTEGEGATNSTNALTHTATGYLNNAHGVIRREMKDNYLKGKFVGGDGIVESFAAKDGDVVTVLSHTSGVKSGEYGKFNIVNITPSQIWIHDHNDKRTIKFNRSTKRGIGQDKDLLLGELVD